jgi:hypothetical protein
VTDTPPGGGPQPPEEPWSQPGSGAPPPPPPPPPQQPGWGQPQPPGYQQPPPGYQQPPPGYQQPYGYQGYGPTKQTEGLAVGALVCAIASWVACPLILAVVALILASNGRKKIQASNGTLDGEGLCTAATVVSWINIGVSVLVGIGIVIAAIAADDNNTTFDLLSMIVG